MLRSSAHLAANKYGQPILGLIFLRYADILYKQHKDEIEAEFKKYEGTRMEKSIKGISIEKCGFYLPECAYYDTINNAPDTAEKAKLVKLAMEAIEEYNPKLAVCPWDFPNKNTGVGCLFLLQEILSIKGSNSHFLPCRWILYC